jgi:2-amino-4-hydroxy-6-hydroxymethyldihydropteridine diphosphokinase
MDKPLWRPAYVGLGSNLEEPRTQVLRALERIRELPLTRLILASPLYRSRPMGPVPQPDFVNAVAALLTQLEARALLDGLREVEAQHGRPPVHAHWGPRVIDLDLLACGQEQRSDPTLTLPHPGIPARNFVLYPLADIAPDLYLPGLGRVAELAGKVSTEGLARL